MAGLPEEAKAWSVEQVKKWAIKDVGIDEEDAAKLVAQKIDGDALLSMSREELRSYGMPGGPALKLMKAIQPSGGASNAAGFGGMEMVVDELRRLRVAQQQLKVPVRFWAHSRGDPVYAFTAGTYAELRGAVEAKIFGRPGACAVGSDGGATRPSDHADGGSGGSGGDYGGGEETIDDYRFYYLANRTEGIDSRSELKDEATFEKFSLLYNLPTVFLFRRTPSAESPTENPRHMERDDSSVHSSSEAEGSTRGNEQARFREFLEERDDCVCVVTGERKVRNANNVAAAHVIGVWCSVEDKKAAGVYKQEYSSVNGFLLGARWHAAFDNYLWCPDGDGVIHLSSEIYMNDVYEAFRPFAGAHLRFRQPTDPVRPHPPPKVLACRFNMYLRECKSAGRDPN